MSTALPLPLADVMFTRVDAATANRLLNTWQHYLGPCRRPFGVEAWLLIVDAPIAVAVSASTVSTTVGPWQRRDTVELARLCTAPGQQWATRVALRLWREVAAPRWPHWRPRAAVAYSQNDRHDGRIYRFDGWHKHSETTARSTGGGTWTKQRGAAHTARGTKTLWTWTYPDPT